MRGVLNSSEVNRFHTLLLRGMSLEELAATFSVTEETLQKYIPAGELGMFYVNVGVTRAKYQAAVQNMESAKQEFDALIAGVTMAKAAIEAYDVAINDIKAELDRFLKGKDKMIAHKESIDVAKAKRVYEKMRQAKEDAFRDKQAAEKALADYDDVRKEEARQKTEQEKKKRAAEVAAQRALVQAAVSAAKEAVVQVFEKQK